MPYRYDMSGRLRTQIQRYPSYHFRRQSSTGQITGDVIRLSNFYVQSEHELEPGHPVQWTGEPAMISNTGSLITTFSVDDMTYALSSVEPAAPNSQTLAGIVIEKAAETTDTSFIHKGIHSTHQKPQNVNLYRVANDIALAWVLEDGLGELEGIYERYVNGEKDTTGPYQLTMISNDQFVINRTMQATIELELADLKARFDALVSE